MRSCCSLKPLLVCSWAVTQVLTWTTLMGAIYTTASLAWPNALRDTSRYWGSFWTTAAVYSVLNLMLILSPLGGALGDVYWGRYKAAVSGKALVTVSMAITSIGSILLLCDYVNNTAKAHTLVSVIIVVSLILLFVGLATFSSNIVQFGLDQLMDKPSDSLGVFVHWLVWNLKVGVTSIEILYATSQCLKGKAISYVLYMVPFVFLLLLVFLHLFSNRTRSHFNIDRVKYNPYKLIYRILNFARKNKYPVGPVSAFTRCYNFQPSRLDYAKERYGGPFTTSDVEDVKSFINVFFLLLTLGPIFLIDLPTSKYFFNKFTLHVGESFYSVTNGTCGSNFSIETMSKTLTVIIFPLYIWIIYSVLENRKPKILYRLVVGALVHTTALVSMLAIDLAGHLMLLPTEHQPKCLFIQTNSTLNFHWSISFIPILLSSFGYVLIFATSLEFISAQSPHTMQGVLVGTFMGVLGLFNSLGAVLLIPLAEERIWKDGYLGEHPPVISCGFGYYLVCLTVALIGLVSLMVAVKRYKYRRRDEEPYSQACVEEYLPGELKAGINVIIMRTRRIELSFMRLNSID